MAKLRLLLHHRNLLMDWVSHNVKPDPQLVAEAEAAHDAAYAAVKDAVIKKHPPEDVRVLRKYDLIGRTGTVRVSLHDGQVSQFTLDLNRFPLTENSGNGFDVPGNRYHHAECVYPLNATASKLFDKWVATRDEHRKEYEKRWAAYRALVQGATYLEDLLPVWPEAAALVPKTGGNVIALGPEQIAIIKHDREQRGVTNSAIAE